MVLSERLPHLQGLQAYSVFASSEFARLAFARLGLGPISLAGLGPISLAERGWHRFDPLAALCPKTHARLSGPPRTASLHRRRLLRGAAALHHPSHGSLRCIRCCAVASARPRFRVVSPGNCPRSNPRAQVIPHANSGCYPSESSSVVPGLELPDPSESI